jgi:hypothetical protein
MGEARAANVADGAFPCAAWSHHDGMKIFVVMTWPGGMASVLLQQRLGSGFGSGSHNSRVGWQPPIIAHEGPSRLWRGCDTVSSSAGSGSIRSVKCKLQGREGAAADENRANFGHGVRLQRVHDVTFMKAPSLHLSSPCSGCFGETQDLCSWIRRWQRLAPFSLLVDHFWSRH